MDLIKDFKEISKSDSLIAGGKGASLGEMTQAGIPVPPGFVILSAVFDRFIEETDLNVEIDAALDEVNVKEVHTLENASEKIQAMIISKETPEDIKEEILKYFKKLDSKFVAVRSSATSEDSASAAWAGQLDSFLNTTKETLLENVKKCWASLFTPRAIFYRFEKRLEKDKIAVAVVVQKMVESEESGIAFSVHPVTQDENQIIIEAGFGLGEAIVSGSITPDSYVIDKQGFNILDINVNEQNRALYKKSKGGNEWKELGEKGKKQVLSEKEIIELSKLIVKIEDHYGFPCDIEWAKEKGKFYIVQSRPITTLSEVISKDESGTLLDNKYIIPRSRESTLSPVHWNCIVQTSANVKKIYGTTLSIEWFILNKNRNKAIMLKKDWQRAQKYISNKILSERDYFKRICKSTQKAKDKIQKWLNSNKIINYSGLDLNTLIGNAEEIKSLFILYDSASVPIWFIAGDLLREKIFDKIKIRTDEFDILTLPKEKSHVIQMDIDFLNAYKTGNLEFESQKLAEKYYWVPFGYDGPTIWTKEYFLDKLKQLDKNKAESKIKKIKLQEKENIKKKEDIIKKYNISKDNFKLIDIMRKMAFFTDDRKMLESQLFYHYSKILEQICNKTGIPYLNLKYLFTEELKSIEKEKDTLIKVSNKRINTEFLTIFKHGKISFGSDKELSDLKEEIKMQEPEKDIKGIVACKGDKIIYQAKVKVLLSPKECNKVNKGDFIVATMTTPDYVIGMKKALGFITDEGGVTCHAAIVSREMNKPCIIGTKIATKVLKDGDLVEVDANKGTVKILKKANDPPSDVEGAKEKGKLNTTKLVLGNQDIDTSMLTLEMTWGGIKDKKVKSQVGLKTPNFSCEIINGRTINGYIDPKEFKIFVEKCVKTILADKNLLKHLKQKSEEFASKVQNIALENINKIDKMNHDSFADMLAKMQQYQKELSSYGTVVAFVDVFGEFSNKTSEIINSRKNLKYPSHIYTQVLCNPEKRSLTEQAYNDIKTSKEPKEKLMEKYFWLDQGYIGRGISKKEIKEIKKWQLKEEILPKKEVLLKELYLTEKEKDILNISKQLIYIKSLRADSRQFIHVVINRIIDKLSKEWNEPVLNLESLTADELIGILKQKMQIPRELNSRVEHSIFTIEKEGYKILKGKKADVFIEENVLKEELKDVNEINGQIANPGKVKGKVKLIFGPQHNNKVQEGDILVSTVTSPQLLPAMKKSAAFVTDLGGITSHAAIVSRELNKPCIVGTEIATQILSDGDLVEVDANKGVVKKLKKNKKEIQKYDKNEGIVFPKNLSLFEIEKNSNYFPVVSRKLSLLYKSIGILGITDSNIYQRTLGFPTRYKPFYDSQRGLYYNRKSVEYEKKEILKKISKYPKYLEKISKKCECDGDKLLDFSKQIKKTDFSKKTDEQIKNITQEIFKSYIEYTAYIMPILSVQEYLEKNIRKNIEKTIKHKKQTEKYLHILTVPIKNNFGYFEQIEILKLANFYKNNKNKIIPALKRKIDRYLFEFSSIGVKYGIGKLWTEKSVIERIIYLSKKYPDKKLKHLQDFPKLQQEKIDYVLKELKADKNFRKSVEIARIYIYLRTYRTDIISNALANMFPLFEEIAKRNNAELEDILKCLSKEIISFNIPPREFLNMRDKTILIRSINGRMYYIYGKEAEELTNNLKKSVGLYNEKDQVNKKINSLIKGSAANIGKVKGEVKIVLDNSQLDKVFDGDILVASMTTPDFVPAMEKASAFITNEGGILCHAAIVSREMNKPCIIGTKIATKVLKDGDLVEVDADKGTVRKINKTMR